MRCTRPCKAPWRMHRTTSSWRWFARTPSSPPPQARQAGEQIRAWMREAGMSAEFDALGNVVGRYEGSNADAPTVMTGSHMDPVVNAGKYDGLFGVLAPVACVAELHRQGRRLAFPIEVVAFGDDEALGVGASMMGSK